MTDELLNARLTKLNLQKIALKNKTQEDKDRYTAYRNYYNTLLRQSKQKYYSDNLNLNVKNPKRSWELLKEAANLNKSRTEIEKLHSNGRNITSLKSLTNSTIFSPVLALKSQSPLNKQP
jgi:hypothetical protein